MITDITPIYEFGEHGVYTALHKHQLHIFVRNRDTVWVIVHYTCGTDKCSEVACQKLGKATENVKNQILDFANRERGIDL